MKKLYASIIQGLISQGYNVHVIDFKAVNNYIRFTCNIKDSDIVLYLEIKYDTVFKVRLYDGNFIDKLIGRKGSSTIIFAGNGAILIDSIGKLLETPELFYSSVKRIKKNIKSLHYVGLKVGKRVFNAALTDKEMIEFSDVIINPSELGKIHTISRHGRGYYTGYNPTTMKVKGKGERFTL